MMQSRRQVSVIFMLATLGMTMSAQTDHPTPAVDAGSAPNSAVIDSIFSQEARLVENMRNYTPLVETYIQNLKSDKDLTTVPGSDRYFLGRLVLTQTGLQNTPFKHPNHSAFMAKVLDRLNSFYKVRYKHLGFMQLVFLNHQFDKEHYHLKYLRQQFLGEVRTLVFDVVPTPAALSPRFLGRIWVEDQ